MDEGRIIAPERSINMGLKHKVTINVSKPNGDKGPVIQSRKKTIRSRMFNSLFGRKVNLLVITPGDTVESVEIKEIKEGGVKHE